LEDLRLNMAPIVTGRHEWQGTLGIQLVRAARSRYGSHAPVTVQ
jgi:hypothetical protein